MFRRLFTGDLYVLMAAFVVLYRLLFKKRWTNTANPT